MEQLSKAALLAALIANDFRYMHWKSIGEDFKKAHDLAEYYYISMDSLADELSELAMELTIPVINVNNWQTVIPDYEVEMQDSYEYLDVAQVAYNKFNTLIGILDTIRNNPIDSDIQSKLDEYLRTWKRERDYKLSQILSTPSKLPQNFIITGLDNYVANRVMESPLMRIGSDY